MDDFYATFNLYYPIYNFFHFVKYLTIFQIPFLSTFNLFISKKKKKKIHIKTHISEKKRKKKLEKIQLKR